MSLCRRSVLSASAFAFFLVPLARLNRPLLPTPCHRPDGSFAIRLSLPEGTHEYRFIVDGEWVHDQTKPTTPNGFGGYNNIVTTPRKN